MNERPKTHNVTSNNETMKKKSINANNANKKIDDKNSKRKQKRLFQMQKRLALFNEEDLPELVSENNINNISNDLNNNIYNSKIPSQISKNKLNSEKNNLSYNFYNSFKDNLNIEKIQHKKIIESQKNNLKKNLIEKKIPEPLPESNSKKVKAFFKMILSKVMSLPKSSMEIWMKIPIYFRPVMIIMK